MRYSKLFTKTRKEAPTDEVSKNAQLLIQAGFIHKEMAGVYAYLPLGLKVIENIKQIVREEMNAIDGQELIMTNLQSRDKWEVTGRWDDNAVDVWFKTRLKDESEIGLAWSHEEPIIEMLKQHITSYKDFPISVYQFQIKLRNELRAKSGIMRGREFSMKDMYSVCIDSKQHNKYYNSVTEAYKKIYQRLGIGDDTYVTFAGGGSFTEFSHEFQTICETGEDRIYLHRGKNIAINEEVLNDENLKKLGINKFDLEEIKTSEVGNIFNFGTAKSEQMDFTFIDEDGQRRFPHLGSYGIGITRVMGVIAEKFSDEKGLIWPKTIAPADVYLIRLGESAEAINMANKTYDELMSRGINVLYDDRDERAGTKFADADLIGIPIRLVVSDRNGDNIEWKDRKSTDIELISIENIFKKLQ
ncbi:MAG: His/Gly/Thr/Pro-type tRNA ligase C-terminal domain-containing protein [Candidatus Levybacteria bacterium]|nr:His/Gly/Thr/Pro-type tRNA ligase C-terminal domain-containing protein [Candidatus Levybacteria bacterium]